MKTVVKHGYVGLLLSVCLLGAVSALAQDTVDAGVAADQWEHQSVRELMQQDLRQALTQADALSRGSPAGPAVRAVLAPRLVALYGVGAMLMAEVQVGQQAYLYVRGQPFPAGYEGDSGVYQLRGMNGACIQLERGDDRHSLCLRMLLNESRP